MAEKYIIYLTFRKVKGLPCDGNSGISEGSIQYTQYSSDLSARLSAQLLRFIYFNNSSLAKRFRGDRGRNGRPRGPRPLICVLESEEFMSSIEECGHSVHMDKTLVNFRIPIRREPEA